VWCSDLLEIPEPELSFLCETRNHFRKEFVNVIISWAVMVRILKRSEENLNHKCASAKTAGTSKLDQNNLSTFEELANHECPYPSLEPSCQQQTVSFPSPAVRGYCLKQR
jgi:hypothetical protein